MRNPVIAAPRRLMLMVIAAFGLALIVPAAGQDRMVLGPRQFETGKSGAGAVLCVWSIYLSVQAKTAACALPRRPVDDAIDQAIVAIDDFILANSSLLPTKAMLEAFKHDAVAPDLSSVRQLGPQICNSQDLEGFRRPAPSKFRQP